MNAGEAALADLFRSEYARVARLAGSIVRDPARAEELAVEAFLRWTAAGPALTGDAAAAWLTRTAVRLAIDELRRQMRRAKIERMLGYFGRRMAVETPEELHAAAQEHDRVRAVLGAMRPQAAELLLLRSEGLSYQALAEALALHPASVGQQLARAQQTFRKEYVRRYGEQWRLGSCQLGG